MDQGLARVIPLQQRRKANRSRRRKLNVARPLVSAWFGAAILAAVVLLSSIVRMALSHGLVGLSVLFVLCASLAWRAASSWLENVKSARSSRDDSRARHPSGRALR